MRTLILGSNGLVGEAFARKCSHSVLCLSRDDLDFSNSSELSSILQSHNIDTVINCAAKVGGIELNRLHPYEMFSTNIYLSLSVLQASINAGVSSLVQFCSNCSYPVSARQPYKEATLFQGEPHPLNKGYAAAKIAVLYAGQCAQDQGLINVFHPIPCSLFGLHDNYSLSNSHFVAAVIRKIHNAVSTGLEKIEFWGTGRPFREFMFADHIVEAVDIMLLNNLSYDPINIGSGTDTPIKDIIEFISSHSGFMGDIIWDVSKPDGALHKLLDSSVIQSHGWNPQPDLFQTLSRTYDYFCLNQNILRL